MIEKKESVIFLSTLEAGATYLEKFYLKKELKSRVKSITVNFAEGQDGTLKVRVSALDGYSTPVTLINMVGDAYLKGNDLTRKFEVDVYLNNNSYLVVEAINDGDYAYTVDVTFEVEYI